MNATLLARSAKAPPRREPTAGPSQNTRRFDSLMRLMDNAPGKAVHFEVAARRNSRVYVAGTFNRWDPRMYPLTYHPEEGLFKATLHLPAGTHEYKFVVDDVWQMDDQCPHWTINSQGTLNSVVRV